MADEVLILPKVENSHKSALTFSSLCGHFLSHAEPVDLGFALIDQHAQLLTSLSQIWIELKEILTRNFHPFQPSTTVLPPSIIIWLWLQTSHLLIPTIE